MNRLQNTILYTLQKAQALNGKPLSLFQIVKLVYLIQTESFKYIGEPFIPDLRFYREKNGPLSSQIYQAISSLSDYIQVKEIPNEDYGHPKSEHTLIKRPETFQFSEDEIIFLNSVLEDYLPLTSKKLKEIVYNTEPMTEVTNQEKRENVLKLGQPLNMSAIPLDEDIVSSLSST